MKGQSMFLRCVVLSFAAMLVVSAGAFAQGFPSKDVRLIVPYAPGGGTDSTARIAGEVLSRTLGVSVIVENRSGAATATGLEYVSKASPDGHTLSWATSDGFSILPAIKPDLSFKPDRDFDFVATTGRYSVVLAVNPQLPIQTIKELIAYAKANPGKLRYSTAGLGSGPHFAAALIGRTAGVEWTHVPYRGAAPAVMDAVAGHVDVTLAAPASIKPHSDSGKLRVLATLDDRRHPQYPEVPTLAESGIAVTVVFYNGVLAPAGTPEAVLARLRKEIKTMVEDPKVADRMRAIGYEPTYLSGAEFKELALKDSARWTDIAKAFNIVLTE